MARIRCSCCAALKDESKFPRKGKQCKKCVYRKWKAQMQEERKNDVQRTPVRYTCSNHVGTGFDSVLGDWFLYGGMIR